MLCDICHKIIFKARSPEPSDGSSARSVFYISLYHPDLKSLDTSANQGSHFCTLLLDGLGQLSSRGFNPFERSKPKPPYPDSEAAQLYCENSNDASRPEVLFAYSGSERSAAFEIAELDSV